MDASLDLINDTTNDVAIGAPSPALAAPPTTRTTGSIRKLLSTYGFIAGDDGIDYFLHWSGMDRRSIDFRRLAIQQRVSFIGVLGSDRHGVKSWRAVSVIVQDED
jgi:cold shock CspA family protein